MSADILFMPCLMSTQLHSFVKKSFYNAHLFVRNVSTLIHHNKSSGKYKLYVFLISGTLTTWTAPYTYMQHLKPLRILGMIRRYYYIKRNVFSISDFKKKNHQQLMFFSAMLRRWSDNSCTLLYWPQSWYSDLLTTCHPPYNITSCHCGWVSHHFEK